VREEVITFLIIRTAIMVVVLIMNSSSHNKDYDHGLMIAILYMRTAIHRPKVAVAIINDLLPFC